MGFQTFLWGGYMRASQSVRPNKRKKSFRRSFILEKNVPWEIKFKSNIALRCITRLPTLAKPRGQLGHLHFESALGPILNRFPLFSLQPFLTSMFLRIPSSRHRGHHPKRAKSPRTHGTEHRRIIVTLQLMDYDCLLHSVDFP